MKNKQYPPLKFNGKTYYFKEGYYRERYTCKGMHRDVWEYYNGDIPEGYEIHHKDRVSWNNDISNLECLSHEEHLEAHRKLGFRRITKVLTEIVFLDIINWKEYITLEKEIIKGIKPYTLKQIIAKPKKKRKQHNRKNPIIVDGKIWKYDSNLKIHVPDLPL